MKKEEELSLIKQIIDGEESLFNKFIIEYSPRVLSVVRGVLYNREDAEEIAQDVFVKAYFSLKSFRGDCSFSTWLYRIAYNMAISKIRQKKGSFIQIDNLSIPDDRISASEKVNDQEELQKQLNILLEELSPSDRFMILSFYMHQKSIIEIAEITGMSESNVKVRLHRIKKRMSLMLKGKMEVSYG
ncbi:MAG: sigma-70 family RNA polymerase sigma factor [Rikenellaceae bacterium]|nr:sigma-70 family RNA polymerase sigma factor [Rikenellaceae bacterium]